MQADEYGLICSWGMPPTPAQSSHAGYLPALYVQPSPMVLRYAPYRHLQVLIPAGHWHSLLMDSEELYGEAEARMVQ